MKKKVMPGITTESVLRQIGYEELSKKLGEYDFVDFFCGAGGMSYGFHQMAEFVSREFSRVGLTESEWLRLQVDR